MVSLGEYLLVVQVLVVLVEISQISAQSCGSSTIELDASITPSYLKSPNYPSNYPPSQKCQWKITAPADFVVVLKFLDFDVEGMTSYRYDGCSDYLSDQLEIYDGQHAENEKLLGRYCSTYQPPKVFSSGTSLLVVFRSDGYNERRGFNLQYSAIIPKPDSTICSPFNTFSQNNNIQVSGSSGSIESPLYGTIYPSNMQCTWVITVPNGNKIKLKFSDFKVGERFYSCSPSHDFVEIRDGESKESALLGQYCSSSRPSPVYSTGRHMWIRFNSNSDNYLDDQYAQKKNGFRASYEVIKLGIPGVIIGIIITVVVGTFLFLVCCISLRRRRATSRGQMAQPVSQITHTYSNQTPPSAPSYPTVHYSPAPQSSYPPPSSGYPSAQESYEQPPSGSHPTSSTTGGSGHTPQPSTSIKEHSSGTFLNDPPPTYREVIPNVPPPPYPGISQNLSQLPTTHHPPTS